MAPSDRAASVLLLLWMTLASAAPPLAADPRQGADRLNKAGIVAENNGDCAKAMIFFKSALTDSNDPESTAVIQQNLAGALSCEGSSAYENADYSKATALFKQALDLEPATAIADRASLRYDLGQTYYQRAAQAHARHDLAEERDALNAALVYDPTEPGRSWFNQVDQEITARSQTASAAVQHAFTFEPSANTLAGPHTPPPVPPVPVNPPTLPPQPPLPTEAATSIIPTSLPPTPHIPWPGGNWHGKWWPPASYDHLYPKFRPTLPTGTTHYLWNGTDYCYFNNIYYTYRPIDAGYVVTDPPPIADGQASLPAHDNLGLKIRALNDQNSQQITLDRIECHRWAVAQTGVDPTSPTSGNDSVSYRRALGACLQGRGYSVE